MVSEVSILIPVYNFDVQYLLKSLLAQCQKANLCFEIICLDDGSDEIFKIRNRIIANKPHVLYEELTQPVGRAAIRNILGNRAKYAYLLFLDNDSGILAEDFILKYLHPANPKQVLIGGTAYTNRPPTPEYTLHWLVGRNREQKPARIRNRYPYQSVHVNNVLVPREIFRQYPFDETITNYGHEDSQWGKRLEQDHIPVHHLDNPVIHLGLETATIFLSKTEQALWNLQQLYFSQQVGAGTPLIMWYLRLVRLRLLAFFYFTFRLIRPFLLYNLRSTRPSLICFDVYKLGIFTRAVRKIKQQSV